MLLIPGERARFYLGWIDWWWHVVADEAFQRAAVHAYRCHRIDHILRIAVMVAWWQAQDGYAMALGEDDDEG